MNILTRFSKIFNKGVSKSLIIYKNNTRIVRNKYKNFEKKFMSEFQEHFYEFVVFLETRKGWWFKLSLLLILCKPLFYTVPYVLGGSKDKMMDGALILHHLENHQREDIKINKVDQKNVNKILYSYWINYV